MMKECIFLLSCLLLSVIPTYGQDKEGDVDAYGVHYEFEAISDTAEVQSIFDEKEPLDITLKYDITSFIRHKRKSNYFDALLLIHYDANTTTEKNIRLKSRGKSRKEKCYFPPIYLNFKTDPISSTDLAGIKKIKLVTHCASSNQYRRYVLKEFLIYKLYNVITPYSLRVRLLDIKYQDTGQRGRNYERYGFIIEPVSLFAERHHCLVINPDLGSENLAEPRQTDLMALFEYMIGNTDWRIKTGHNIMFIKPKEILSPYALPIPYDFDHAGLINTSYAKPQEWTSIENVREREYLGYCRNVEAYRIAIEHFLDKKEEIFRVIDEFDLLEDKERQNVVRYIQTFYDLLEHPRHVMESIMRNECRTDF